MSAVVEERRRGLEVAVYALQARRLELREVFFRKQTQRGAEADLRNGPAHLAQSLAHFLYVIVRKATPGRDDPNAIGPVRLGILRGLHTSFRAHPAVVLAACLPVRGLRAPLAVLAAASAPRVDDGTEIEALLHASPGHLVRPLSQLLAPLRAQQGHRLFSRDRLHHSPAFLSFAASVSFRLPVR